MISKPRVQDKQEGVHPYVLWTKGRCEGCRKSPLPPASTARAAECGEALCLNIGVDAPCFSHNAVVLFS
jgi:hypothetical protein